MVLRRQELETLQDRAARPLWILAWSQGHVLISNRPGSRRSRELRALLDAGGQALEDAFARSDQLLPGGVVTMIEFADPGGEPTCSLSLERAGETRVVSFAIAAPPRMTVARDVRPGGDDRGGRVLIRLAVSHLPPAGVGRLLRTFVGE